MYDMTSNVQCVYDIADECWPPVTILFLRFKMTLALPYAFYLYFIVKSKFCSCT